MENKFVTYATQTRAKLQPLFATSFATQSAHTCVQEDIRTYLYAPLEAFLQGGGKRVRPILVLLGCELCDGNAQAAEPVALATERFQAAALIHDDIADQSLLRHGAPALYVSEGEGVAINCGDSALVESFTAILEAPALDACVKQRLLGELVAMMRRTLEGQALDLGWARDPQAHVLEDAYCAMATLKTAHYSVATPLVLGAIVARATMAQTAALRAFGLAAGLAFQIHDDLMNVVGDEQAQDKDFRSDLVEGKLTLLVVYALEHGNKAQQKELQKILSAHTHQKDKLARAVCIFEETGAVAYAQNKECALYAEAKQAITNVSFPNKAATEVLCAMLAYFESRTY